jgi:hypothetical protein
MTTGKIKPPSDVGGSAQCMDRPCAGAGEQSKGEMNDGPLFAREIFGSLYNWGLTPNDCYFPENLSAQIRSAILM